MPGVFGVATVWAMVVGSSVASDLLYPLSRFAEREGRAVPECVVLPGEEVPEPYQALLVHDGDMTSRLEHYYSASLVLRVLQLDHDAAAYRREVLLCTSPAGLPVEYGAIEIELGVFDGQLQSEILAGRLPLGGLLNRHGVAYHSRPRGFLKVAPDAGLAALFQLAGPVTLYGRCNVLCTDAGVEFARIVEILRP